MKPILLLALCVVLSMTEDVIPLIQEFRTGNLIFTAKTYTELSKLNNNNLLVCPLSVSTVLALIEAGAGGNTAQQLLSGLNFPDSTEKTKEAYKIVSPSLNVESEYSLTSANKVYVKEGFEINSQFQQVATDVFNAEVQKIDFSKIEAVSDINEWVLQKTKNKIKDIVKRKDLDQDTRAVLVNALYFYGDWVKPFKPEKTKRKTFYAIDKKVIEVNMMDQTSEFNYYEDNKLNAKFLEMFYEGGDISMTFVLPNAQEGLPALEAKINEVLKTPQYNSERVHVQMPNINEEHSINFIPILQKFGIEDLFSSKSNLTGIGAHKESLYVSKVIQKTFIDIAEKGTTAAAATAVFILPGHPAPPLFPPKEFNADHPFIYYLKYRYGILFIGRYVGSK